MLGLAGGGDVHRHAGHRHDGDQQQRPAVASDTTSMINGTTTTAPTRAVGDRG
jgi:hypothetical protein